MPYKEIKILKQHGIQYIKDLKNVKLTPLFRGMPVIGNNISETEAQMIQNLCPVNAIGTSPFSIDLGKCVFCKECQFVSKGKIIFSNNYKIATNKRQNLIITANSNTNTLIDETLIRKEIRKTFRSALKLRQVSAAGDNSAEMELNASMNVNFDLGRYGIEFVASPRHADGIVITGPISENMAKALQICYDAVPDPKIIILVGTDAISGSIFAESKAINREFLDKYHVDLYVPGNPPHPLTFINGILELLKR